MGTLVTIRLPRPLGWQSDVLGSRSRFSVLACGRRSGKSTLGQHQLIHTALQGKPAGYFSPTYKLLGEFWRELRAVVEPITKLKSEQDHRLELVTGGAMELWSLDDPNPARGRKYARVVLDEAAMVPNLLDIWQLAIRPTLADFGGDAWFLSTPRGLNDFHRLL